MKKVYSKFQFFLMTFTLGLAAVYAWSGFSLAHNEVPVRLPTTVGTDNVLVVFPSAAPYTDYESREDRLARIIGNRDLSSYDQGAYAPSCYSFEKTFAECLATRQAARDFIYTHFKDNRKGYIKVGFPCTDCGSIDHFFIEPDENGRWKVTITLDTNGPLSTSTALSVRFRRAKEDERYDGYTSRVLSLVDAHGHEIEAF